jgi:hypothetical protein
VSDVIPGIGSVMILSPILPGRDRIHEEAPYGRADRWLSAGWGERDWKRTFKRADDQPEISVGSAVLTRDTLALRGIRRRLPTPGRVAACQIAHNPMPSINGGTHSCARSGGRTEAKLVRQLPTATGVLPGSLPARGAALERRVTATLRRALKCSEIAGLGVDLAKIQSNRGRTSS